MLHEPFIIHFAFNISIVKLRHIFSMTSQTPAMLNVKNLLLVIFITAALNVGAQAPPMLNYQAIVRNAAGNPVSAGTVVNLRFSIHDASANGTVLYTETVPDTANKFGLVTARIGAQGNLSNVNWGNGAKYLQVETDIGNTGNYTDMGSSQLVSVPYALYALNSAAGPTGANGVTGPMGPAGATGLNGATGVTGQNGVAGVTGSTGANGATGNAGVTGAAGLNGATGTAGTTGVTGATGPNGVAGATGAQGIAGNAGATGATGVTGVSGPSGANGSSGQVGATGLQGAQGLPGATGPTGPSGPTGNNGATGGTGVTGNTGPSGADGAGSPIGSVTAFAGVNVPAGWLVCDGSVVSRTTYSNLFAVIGNAWGDGDGVSTFNLPDLQGRFLRGVDNGTGRDPDAASRTASNNGGNTGSSVGTVEDQQYLAHTHGVTDPGHFHKSVNTDVVRNTGGYGTGIGTGGLGPNQITMTTNTTGISINNSGGTETRPKNAAVYFIIKY